MQVLKPMFNKNKSNISLILSFIIVLSFFVLVNFASCKNNAEKEKIKGAKYKSISLLLKESQKANIHMDRKASHKLIELISERTASEILSLNNEEKDEVLKIALTASVDVHDFLNCVAETQNNENLKKNMLKMIDINQNLSVLKVLLSDFEYLKSGKLDGIMFAMMIMLSRATNIMGYDVIDDVLKNRNPNNAAEIISKTNLDIVLYSYALIKNRQDINEIKLGQTKLIDLLPEMRINY